jgi:hypothetical protein
MTGARVGIRPRRDSKKLAGRGRDARHVATGSVRLGFGALAGQTSVLAFASWK